MLTIDPVLLGRGTVVGCLLIWSAGPLAALALTAHGLEHHDPRQPPAGWLDIVLHGHFHADEVDEHRHAVTRASDPGRVTSPEEPVPRTLTAADPRPSGPPLASRLTPPPEPAGAGPPPLAVASILRL